MGHKNISTCKVDLLLERTILESLCFDNQSVVKIQRFNSFGPVKEYTDDLYFYLSSSPSHLPTSSDFFSFRLKVRASTFEYSESELFSLNMCCPRRKSPFNTPKQCWPPKKSTRFRMMNTFSSSHSYLSVLSAVH